MNEGTFNQPKLNAYLLGALTAAETERFDELSFTDDDFAAALRLAEDDLVDAYVNENLSGADLESFTTHYLASPMRREKIEFAKNLQTYAAKNNSSEIARISSTESELRRAGFFAGIFTNLRFWQMGFAAATLMLMIFGGWLLIENSRLRNRFDESATQQTELQQRDEITAQTGTSADKETEIARLREESARIEKERERQNQQSEREQRQIAESERRRKQTETPSTTAPRSPVIAFFTLAPQLRGGGLPTISVPPDADSVTMRLELEPHDFARYRVALKNQTGNKILWKSGNLKARAAGENKILNVKFPARLLRAQTYALEVSGIGADGKAEIITDYFFRNVR